MARRPISPAERDLFDRLLEEILAELPAALSDLLEEVPLIVDDRPSARLAAELNLGPGGILCGLHDGIPLTERSVEHSGTLPSQLMIFREGVLAMATNRHGVLHEPELRRQIHITLLHEIGHHFGLDEDDLDRLGYG